MTYEFSYEGWPESTEEQRAEWARCERVTAAYWAEIRATPPVDFSSLQRAMWFMILRLFPAITGTEMAFYWLFVIAGPRGPKGLELGGAYYWERIEDLPGNVRRHLRIRLRACRSSAGQILRRVARYCPS